MTRLSWTPLVVLAIDEALMNEIAAVKEATNPDETLFVVDAMTGTRRREHRQGVQ